jgi:4-alpha-glucanotransferase
LEKPIDISPYAPASRLFWNEFYVDPRKAPEFLECPAAQTLVNSSEWQREVQVLRDSRLVDHARLMALKRPVIEAMARWLVESKSERREAFENYVRSHHRLTDYAEFRAVLSRRQAPWQAWPQPLRDGKLREADYEASDRLYHFYAQWLAEEQVRALETKSAESGGLYLDFPLGVHSHSYDVWRERDIFALGASAGSPPDTLFTKGQNWNFPPLHPEAIRRAGYAYLIACFRHQFRRASWFRMDHVMALHRLFWIPQGMEAKDGVYVQYRPEEMYAILSLESHRSKTVVVGENLGTVPAAVNRAMERHGLQQMYVLQYEARPNRRRPLRAVPANAVASLNTHDMPPFAGFVACADIEDLGRLGVFDEREERDQKRARQKVCRALAEFFQVKGKKQSADKLAQKCLEWLARSEAKMVLVNLEDLWGETAPQNVPGTSEERPNWQRKARYSLEEFTPMPRVVNTLRRLHRIRSSFASKPRQK